jgi:hypothetical protein
VDLVGLLYRADGTRLDLSGSVSVVTGDEADQFDIDPDTVGRLTRSLRPSWLLSQYTLGPAVPVTACGRDALRVVATARTTVIHGEVTEVVIDTETGILLRCAYVRDGQQTKLIEFTQLAVHGPASEPPPADDPDEGETENSGQGWEAVKLAGGLALAGLGAFVKYWPHSPADGRQVEMPPAEPPEPGPGSEVSDEVLRLLYQSGQDGLPFTATVHMWADLSGLLRHIPPDGRKAGFGGLGFFADAVTERVGTTYLTSEVRASGPLVYRIDVRNPNRRQMRAEACDGHVYRQLFQDRMVTRSARTPTNGLRFLDTSWLLGERLTGCTEVTVGGRPAVRLRVDPEVPALSPIDVIIDAELGVALRQVTAWRDVPFMRTELTDVTPGPVDTSITIPPGIRTIEETGDLLRDAFATTPGVAGSALRGAAGLLHRVRSSGDRG